MTDQSSKISMSERDALFSTSGTAITTTNGDKINGYSACSEDTNSNDNDIIIPSTGKYSISLISIILLQLGQIFNYLQGKSYKIYSGYIHTDLGISYKMLTYTVFVSGYVTIIHLFASKYYNYIPCNIYIFVCFLLAALSALLLYYGYRYTFIIFLSRPLITFATFGLWNFVISMIPNFVSDKSRNTAYITWWNSAYPISTFCLVITGVIIHNLSYFDYLLYSAMIALVIGSICLFILPSCSIYSLSIENRIKIDKQISQSIFLNIFDICANNKIFICMMCTAAMDAMLLSTMNLLVGPYLKDNYTLNPQQLGIYVTVSIGIAELFTSIVIYPYIAVSSRFHILIVAGTAIEFIAIIIWNIFHISTSPPFIVSLIVISFVYLGHECSFCGIMFKNQTVAHKSQQVFLVSFWSIIITLSGSIGNIMVGQLYEMKNGVGILLLVLAILGAAALCSGVALCYFQYKRRLKIYKKI
eukprot:262449_1